MTPGWPLSGRGPVLSEMCKHLVQTPVMSLWPPVLRDVDDEVNIASELEYGRLADVDWPMTADCVVRCLTKPNDRRVS